MRLPYQINKSICVMNRKEFLKNSGLAVGLTSLIGPLSLKSAANASRKLSREDKIQTVCTLVPSETLGPFPSLPSGDSMYWRSDLTDSQAGVPFTFTIKLFGTNNCGVLVGYRVDVWHCNAHAFYSHYATGGTNNGHSGQNTPSGNINLIYGRGTQVSNSQGEVTFTSIFPGWYNGRTCHIHFAIYSGGTVGSPNGWTLERVSQFTFPIAAKNTLYTSHAPYSTYGADPLLPDNDNVFNSPAGSWSTLQLGTLVGPVGGNQYSSFYETAITATGILPLDLIGFNGSLKGQSAVIWWKTANEENFSHFEVEYSFDGDDFEYLDTVESKGNGLKSDNNYLYEDNDKIALGNVYYRLKMVDYDGRYKYSAPVVVRNNNDINIRIISVPAGDVVSISHPLSNTKSKAMIIDINGRIMGIADLYSDTTQSHIDISACPDGIYFLLYDNGMDSKTLKFIKQGH
mgnify:CR=1 FL=1